ncbi:MAG: alpha/beta fold hydrolase [Allosphingosinicella sp.]
MTRKGSGKPLLLVHGLGGSRRSWSLIERDLAARREVIAIDLPGHGDSPAEADSDTFAGLTRSLDAFLDAHGLASVDMAGSSMGARMVLELARRGRAGAVVALDPGGFWQGWERTYLEANLIASVKLVRALRPTLPALARSAAARTMLLPLISARPWALHPEAVETELRSFAATATFEALTRDLARGPAQRGPAGEGAGPVTIVWGRQDRICLPRQAERALAQFPGARLRWLDRCGHYPMWDRPDETVALILESTG